jgi:thiol-disulfide isomerase/thioredoxin
MRTITIAALLTFAVSARADLKQGDHARDFEQKTLNGSTVKLSQLRGKVVLLDFWASWCEPCKKELPLLAKLAPRLKQKGVEIVAVNIVEQKANAVDFIKTNAPGLTVVYDKDHKIVSEYEPPKMPSSFVIDKNGVIRAVNAGFESGDEAKIEKQLTSLK